MLCSVGNTTEQVPLDTVGYDLPIEVEHQLDMSSKHGWDKVIPANVWWDINK